MTDWEKYLQIAGLTRDFYPEYIKNSKHNNKKSEESESEVAQSCPTLCNPVDGSLPGSSVHGILQARVLEWVAISFSRGSSRPRDQTWVFSHTVGRRFTLLATREAHRCKNPQQNFSKQNSATYQKAHAL